MMVKKIILLFLLLGPLVAIAQQDPLFTQYTFNKLLVNPAYAGSREATNVTLLSRTQWVNIDGAPQTYTLSVHTAMNSKKIGLGFYVYRDILGPTVRSGLMGTYAYRLLFPKSSLSFGIQLGLKHSDFDWAAMNLKDENDVIFSAQDVRKIIPDMNLGIYYQSSRFFAGLSSKQLLENEIDMSKATDANSFSKLTRHFYLMAGTAIPLENKMVLRPSALAKYTSNAPVQFDFNASLFFGHSFMIGASYRTMEAITFLSEIALTESIKLGYSYDIYLNELQPFNYGSHEIRLEFDLGLKGTRMRTPRYF